MHSHHTPHSKDYTHADASSLSSVYGSRGRTGLGRAGHEVHSLGYLRARASKQGGPDDAQRSQTDTQQRK